MKHALLIVILLAAAAVSAAGAFAQPGPGYEVQLPNIGVGTPRTPAEYVRYVYILGLGLGGILAFGMIVFAGLQWSLSGGNTSWQEDAKDRIRNAIFGLILLFGAYVILRTINPELVRLRNPSVSEIRGGVPSPSGTPRLVEGGPSPVAPYSPDPYGVDIQQMNPEARQSLENMIECATRLGGTVQVNSAYRPQAYQDHLKEVFCKYQCAIEGNDPQAVAQRWKYATYCGQYVDFPCTPGHYEPRYNSAIANINTEWSRHGLVAAPANVSRHSNGCSVDMNVSGVNPGSYGFIQPIVKDDPVHYDHAFCPTANQTYNPPCQP